MSKIMLDGVSFEVTANDQALFDAWETGEKAQQNRAQRFVDLLNAEKAKAAVLTFAEYERRQKVFKALCVARKVGHQSIWRDLALAVKGVYGAIPQSQAPDAVKKRAQREAKKADNRERALAIGLVKPKEGEVVPPVSKFGVAGKKGDDSKEESPEQHDVKVLEDMGLFRALAALEKVLSGNAKTAAKAKALASLHNQLRKELKVAEVPQTEPKTGTHG